MGHSIKLPEKLASSSVAELTQLLGAPAGDEIQIDGREVRMIGARAAERLCRFVCEARAGGTTVTIAASPDLEEDLRVIGLHDVVLAGERAQ